MTPGSCLTNEEHTHHACPPSIHPTGKMLESFQVIEHCFCVCFFSDLPVEVISSYVLSCCLDKVPLSARPYGENRATQVKNETETLIGMWTFDAACNFKNVTDDDTKKRHSMHCLYPCEEVKQCDLTSDVLTCFLYNHLLLFPAC